MECWGRRATRRRHSDPIGLHLGKKKEVAVRRHSAPAGLLGIHLEPLLRDHKLPATPQECFSSAGTSRNIRRYITSPELVMMDMPVGKAAKPPLPAVLTPPRPAPASELTPRTLQHRHLQRKVQDILRDTSSLGRPVGRSKGDLVNTPKARVLFGAPAPSPSLKQMRRVSFDYTPRERLEAQRKGPDKPPQKAPHIPFTPLGKPAMRSTEFLNGAEAALPPTPRNTHLVLIDMDRLVFSTANDKLTPLPDAEDCLKQISSNCEVVLWTARSKPTAIAASEAIGNKTVNAIIYNFPVWFAEVYYEGKLLYTRPGLLDLQQTTRSEPLSNVLIFEGRADAVRGYRQNSVLVSWERADPEFIMPSILACTKRLINQRLAVPEFLAVNELLSVEKKAPYSSNPSTATDEMAKVSVPVLRPSANAAEEFYSSLKKKSLGRKQSGNWFFWNASRAAQQDKATTEIVANICSMRSVSCHVPLQVGPEQALPIGVQPLPLPLQT
eukprot:Sspe_Gene.24910::Locus_9936_Transcript_5_6_Confidence_0.182_Length_1826::g.24910::m.24910